MEKEANRPAAIAIDMNRTAEVQDENPTAWSLFAKIRSAVSVLVVKILKKNDQPSIIFDPPPPEVPVVALRLDATAEEEISRSRATTPSPEIKPGLQHPVFKIIMEQKLGKSMLSIGVPTAIAVLVSGGSIGPKTLMFFTYIMVSGLCVGCAAIWNGILLRETFPREANVIELLGIVLVLICLSGVHGWFISAARIRVASYSLRRFVPLPFYYHDSAEPGHLNK